MARIAAELKYTTDTGIPRPGASPSYEMRASATLPASGAYALTTNYFYCQGYRKAFVRMKYTAGANLGQGVAVPVVAYKTLDADPVDTDWSNVLVTQGTYTAAALTGAITAYTNVTLKKAAKIVMNPCVLSTDVADGANLTLSGAMEVPLPLGCTHFGCLVAEVGVTGTPGTMALDVTFGT
jgi:hypothetical protein